MSSVRKSGSGRKRKCDSLTSKDYARKLEALKWRPGMTREEQAAFKKEQRSLKNRLSALKSREKKRAQMESLQQQILILQRKVEQLTQENTALKQGLCPVVDGMNQQQVSSCSTGSRQICGNSTKTSCSSAGDAPYVPPTKRSRIVSSSVRTAISSDSAVAIDSNSVGKSDAPVPLSEVLPLPSLDELIPQQPTASIVKSEPCALNCGSALGDAMEDFAFDVFDALDNSSLFEHENHLDIQPQPLPELFDDRSFFSLVA